MPKQSGTRPVRCWQFTLNNPTDQQIKTLKSGRIREGPELRYWMWGEEVGERGTPHLQGMLLFLNKVSFKAVKKLMEKCNCAPHLEPCASNARKLYEYNAKGDQSHEQFEKEGVKGADYGKNAKVWESSKDLRPVDPKEAGKRGGDAEKERWKEAKQLAQDGKLDDLDPELFIRYYNTFKRIAEDAMPVPDNLDNIDGRFLWYYGDTGSGKSRKARDDNPNIYIKNANKWWDGYYGQDCVLLEEMSPEAGKYLGSFLKTWADHYSFNAEVKGGTKMLRPPKLIVTSNYSIQQCFPDPAVHDPLNRRFIKLHFQGKYGTRVTKTEYPQDVYGPDCGPRTAADWVAGQFAPTPVNAADDNA